MTALYGVYGAGGCGRGIMPLLEQQVSEPSAELVFIDDAPRGERVNGRRVLTWQSFVDASASRKAITIGIANSNVREAIDRKRAQANIGLFNVISASSVILHDVELGEGCVISPLAILTANIRIGINFHCNIGSFVEHDCCIGDYVTFGPGVRCNGNVHIADHAYVGSGAVIRQGTADEPLRIGRGAVVGMGAVVTRSVSPGMVVVGNPARPLRK